MNLRAVLLVARANARRRGGSLLLLVALVALVVGVVLAGLAGAHRSATVLDRYRRATDQSDAGFYAMGLPAADAPSMARRVPGVRDAVSSDFFLAVPDRPGLDKNFGIAADPRGRYGVEVNRALVTEGRMPDAERADEVALNEPAARALHLSAGDELSVHTMSPAGFQRLLQTSTLDLDGPDIRLKVVGVVRLSDDLQGSTQQSSPLALGTPAFSRAYSATVAVNGSTTAVRGDASAVVPRLRKEVAGFEQSSVTTAAQSWLDTTSAAVQVVVVALIVFAAAASLAGGIAVGQAVSRQVSAASDDLPVVRAVGLTRRERVLALALPPGVGAVLGSVLGVGVAVIASPLFPVAVARSAEPDPGMQVDLAVIAGGWVVSVVAVAVWAVWTAVRRDRRMVAPARARSPRPGALRIPIGSGLVTSLGIRLAVEPRADGGRSGVPTRSALLGVAAGIAGVVAAVVFTASLNAAINRPADYGWTWTSRPDQQAGDGEALLRSMAKDGDLSAVGAALAGDASVDGRATPLVAFDTFKGSLVPPVLEGRLPTGDGEVAVGSSVLEVTGHSIGDRVQITVGGQPERTLRIVGAVVGNQLTSLPDLGDVAVVTPQAVARLAGAPDLASLVGDKGFDPNILLSYRSGVQEVALERRLAEQYHLFFMPYSRPSPPGRLLSMDDMRPLLVGLGAFFALLGTVGLVHVLVVSTRRRAREFGVLAALGLVRRQRRAMVSVQALTLIAAGLVIGIPSGVVIGRVAWRAAIGDLGMVVSAAGPWTVVASLAAVALAATWAISLVPGSWASHVRPAELLRTE